MKANTKLQGLCISIEQDSFDFHFTHTKWDDEHKLIYEVHNRVCFRSDLISFLKENGQLPILNLGDNVKLIQEKSELVQRELKLIEHE